jgi:hypothetical protein
VDGHLGGTAQVVEQQEGIMNDQNRWPAPSEDEFLRLMRLGEEASRTLAERDRERDDAVRVLVLDRRVCRFEARAWAEAWLDAGKPLPIEPWVSNALGHGQYFDFETATLTDRPETPEKRAERLDRSARAGEAERRAKSMQRDLRRHTNMEGVEIALWVERAIAEGIGGNIEGWVSLQQSNGVAFDPDTKALINPR